MTGASPCAVQSVLSGATDVALRGRFTFVLHRCHICTGTTLTGEPPSLRSPVHRPRCVCTSGERPIVKVVQSVLAWQSQWYPGVVYLLSAEQGMLNGLPSMANSQ